MRRRSTQNSQNPQTNAISANSAGSALYVVTEGALWR